MIDERIITLAKNDSWWSLIDFKIIRMTEEVHSLKIFLRKPYRTATSFNQKIQELCNLDLIRSNLLEISQILLIIKKMKIL